MLSATMFITQQYINHHKQKENRISRMNYWIVIKQVSCKSVTLSIELAFVIQRIQPWKWNCKESSRLTACGQLIVSSDHPDRTSNMVFHSTPETWNNIISCFCLQLKMYFANFYTHWFVTYTWRDACCWACRAYIHTRCPFFLVDMNRFYLPIYCEWVLINIRFNFNFIDYFIMTFPLIETVLCI